MGPFNGLIWVWGTVTQHHTNNGIHTCPFNTKYAIFRFNKLSLWVWTTDTAKVMLLLKWMTDFFFSNSSDRTHKHVHAEKKERKRGRGKSSQMFYSLLNLSVIAVRVASTQQSPGLLQGLLNGFTSSSHSAARTETLNTSLQSINNGHTLPLRHLTHTHRRGHPNTHRCPEENDISQNNDISPSTL